MKGMFVLCALLSLAPAVQAAPGGTLPVLANRFGAEALIDAEGRLLVAPNGARLQRLAADRWMRMQGEGTPQQWFDDGGALLREDAGYVEYGESFVLPGAAGASPLWQAFLADGKGVRLGRAVVDALGQVRWPALPDGQWAALAVPDRVLWTASSAPLRFFDLAGQPVMDVDEHAWQWVAGPFPGRPVYVLCAVEEDAPCRVMDEAGTVVFADHIDALLPVADGGWWLRQRDLWRRVDARGRPLDAVRYRQAGLYPRFRQYGGAAGPRDWPDEVTRLADGHGQGTPARGWLLADGRFQALPRQRVAYCGGRWWIGEDEDGAPWQPLADAVAAVMRAPDEATRQAPPWRLRAASAGRGAAVLDCAGAVVFEPGRVERFDSVDGALLGTFAGEHAPRLWWDGRSAHEVPAGLAIDDDHLAPPLLLLRDQAAGRQHVYNLALGRVVGRSIEDAAQVDERAVVFRRDGQLGLMLADGREPLAADYLEILPWGEDRTWTRRALDEGGEELALLDADYHVLLRRHLAFSGVTLETTWQGAQPGHAVARLNLGTMPLPDGPYFVQQWVDRNGRVLVSDVSCPAAGADVLASGAGVLLGQGWRVDTTPAPPCRLPAALTPLLQGGDAPR
ncbi:hypothetical protein [Stenotrophomonas sp.]|uniref:hypothetical protein n=1 Tax=Stenotrophomonas sp. TaxID=69392 RepID=UPI002FC9624D